MTPYEIVMTSCLSNGGHLGNAMFDFWISTKLPKSNKDQQMN